MKTTKMTIAVVAAFSSVVTTCLGSLVFDGVNDYVDFARPVSGDLTIECWFRSTQLKGGEAQWYQGMGLVDGEVNGLYNDFGLAFGNGKALFGTGNPDITIRSTSTLNDGHWHHLAATRQKSTGALKLYVDGVLQAAGTGNMVDLTAPARMRLGSLATTLNFFQGQLDEVRVWNVVRDAAQIAADMRRSLTGTEPGLVLCFRLDESVGTLAHDFSASAYHGTLVNGPLWSLASAPGGVPAAFTETATDVTASSATLYGSLATNALNFATSFEYGTDSPCLSFDGISQYVHVPGFATNAPTNEITIEFWQKVDAARGHETFMVNLANSANWINAHTPWTDGTVYWDFGNIGTAGRLSYKPPVSLIGTWQHFALVASQGGNYMRIYRNGILEAQKSGMTPFARGDFPLLIGGGAGYRYKGQLDEFRVWRVARSAGEIQANMCRPLTGSEANLVGYWRMDEGQGVQARDSSPAARHGLIVNNPNYDPWTIATRPSYQTNTPPVSFATEGAALQFDGVDDYVDVPDGVWFNGDFTFEGWVNPQSFGNWSRLIDFGNGQNADNVLLGYSAGTTGQPRCEVRQGTTIVGAVVATQPIPLNQWSHLAVTLQGSTLTLFINGSVAAASSSQPPRNVVRTLNFIGRSNWADTYANALFDEVRIWSVARSRAEILAGMSQRLSGNELGLRACWRFDEATGTAALDSSTNAQHATLVNVPERVPLQQAAVTLTGLPTGATYHYRAVATDTNGVKTFGADQSFTTLNATAGNALALDGVDDFARVGANVIPSSGDFTVEAWAYMPALPLPNTGREILSQGSSGNAFYIGYEPTSRSFRAGDGWATTGVPFPLDKWTHVAVVKTGGNTLLYTNGVLARSKGSTIPNPAASGFFDLGRQYANNAEFWSGKIDEVRVWNVARDATQILLNFNRRLSGTNSGLTALYRFDEGAGSVVLDSSPSQNHGLLYNGVGRTDSDASINLPVPGTLAATSLVEDKATLNGTVVTDGTATTAWFEWGTNLLLSSTTENVGVFYNVGTTLSSVFNLPWETSVPAAVQQFANINWYAAYDAAWPGGPLEYFGTRYHAQFFAPRDGYYGFYVNSDDGSALFVDGNLVVNSDGLHGAVGDVGGTVYLSAGRHAFEVFQFENTGHAALIVSYSGPGIPKQVIPASAFQEPTLAFLSNTPPQVVLNATQAVTAALTNLWPGTHYYRLVTANAAGTNYGALQSFDVFAPASLTALEFDGTGDYALTPNLRSFFPSETVTIEAWFNANAPGIIIDERGNQNLANWADSQIEIVPVATNAALGDVRIRVWDLMTVPSQRVGLSLGLVEFGTWNHVVLRYDKSALKLDGFLNGTRSTASLSGDRAAPWESGYGLFYGIGLTDSQNLGSGAYFNGLIDEVRIWSTARTDSEITGNYTRRLTGKEANLVAYYRFDDRVGVTASDSSPNGNHAILFTALNVVAVPLNGPTWVASRALADFPLATTLPAAPVQAKSATLRGLVNPAGLPTSARFEWGTTTNYGNLTEPARSVGAGISQMPFEEVLTGLDPGVSYHYRLWAGNGAGSTVGEDLMFTTLTVGVGWPVATKMSQWDFAAAPRHTLDAAGNVYLTGLSTIAPESIGGPQYPSGAGTLAFVSKLSARGDWAWITNVFSASNSMAQVLSVAVGRDTSIYVAGQCAGTNRFGAFTLASALNNTNAFVAKLDNLGQWLWATSFGGAGLDIAHGIALGTNSEIYIAGRFSGTNVAFGTNVVTSVGGSDVFVGKLTAEGIWQWVRTGGSATDGEAAVSVAVDAAEQVFITGRFAGTGVYGLNAVGPADLFVASFNSRGNLQYAKRGGGSGDDSGNALALDAAGNVYVLGQFVGSTSYEATQLPTSAGTNLVVLRLKPSLGLDWVAVGPAVKADSIAVDRIGHVYVSGEYAQTVLFGAISLTAAGATDLFVAQLPSEVLGSAGRWTWVNSIGDLGVEGRGSVAVDFTGDVLVSGSFQNTLEMGYVSLSVREYQDIFVARLRPDRTYEHNTWTIGQAVPIPAEAKDLDDLPLGKPTWIILDKTGQPDADEMNSFVWGEGDQQLYPVRPVTALIKWPTSKGDTNMSRVVSAVGNCVWPEHPQIHVAGAPAEVDPQNVGFQLKYLSQPYASSPGAAVDSATMIFNATQPGYTVLQFLRTGGNPINPLTQPNVFEVVQTVAYNDPAHLDEENAEIGATLTRAGHNDPTGKNGFVLFANALYDGTGSERAYDRASRMGPIIPVNKIGPATNAELVVIWYHTNENTGIAWPDDPVRYQADWPENVPTIVIASQLGFGPVDAVNYPAAHVYNQPDPTQPGFNPNEEHALLVGETLYALRDDLNAIVHASAPYALLKHRNPFDGQWTMKVVKVEAENEDYTFLYDGVAGKEIEAPKPLRFMTLCRESVGVRGPYFEDYNGKLYARAAGPLNGNTNIVLHWFYPLHPSFFYQLTRFGSNDAPVGTCIPWLDRRTNGMAGVPTDVTYDITWPPVEHLEVGDNLFNPKLGGLPGIQKWASATLIHDQANPYDTNALNSLARLYDPLSDRVLQLRPADSTSFLVGAGWEVCRVADTFNLVEGLNTANVRGKLVFVDLPYSLRSRLSYDPLNKNLSFSGLLNQTADYGGPDNPLILVNVMTERERDRIKRLDGDHPPSAQSGFDDVIDALFHLTRNPNRLDVNRDGVADQAWLIGLAYGYVTNLVNGRQVITTNIVHEKLDDRPKLLTAAPGTGSGYVTLVQNDDARLAGLPVTLTLLRVEDGPYRGDLKVLFPDNVFDEKLTLRHSSDFGGVPEPLEFEWYYHPATDTSVQTNLPYMDGDTLVLNGWTYFGSGRGMNDITIGDGSTSTLLTLFDNYFVCRYRGYVINGETNWSDWAGVIGGGRAQLAPGWIKRVITGLNPFEARSKDFHESPTATYASMIQQAGARYEGDIAFNPSADNLNSIGLISAYETILRRGRSLSIDSVEQIDDSTANSALLLAAGRIAEFYMLLGNEAYADAADPTIGFRTDQAGYGTLAPSIFTFQNQLDSLLEEELALLRGRDDRSATVKAPPFYNRLIWNFTKNEGEVAYSQTYNISDQNADGLVNAEDARIMYPQAHGDAWGHYLTATKTYYNLLRSPNYTWEPRSEDILLAGVPVEVDYQDERKFARAASAKAKTGAEIVDLTYRLNYVDDPAGQYQGYRDTDADRAWGLSEWARRASQGAYFDWATANAILPATDPNTNHTGIQKIDRTTVLELSEIVSAHNTVQSQLDKADVGLNPLGLAKNVVPFDIDPTLISTGKTHFEQIYGRALGVMDNAVTVFNHANQLSQSLRALQDSVDDLAQNGLEQERDYKNRLIEVFGYPYAGDIGPGGTYPSGYDGPDLYHYMYVNTVELNGDTAPPSQTFTAFYSQIQNMDHAKPGSTFDFLFGKKDFFFPEDVPTDLGDRFTNDVLAVNYPFTPSEFGFLAPTGWGQRRAPGEIQIALSEMVQSHARLKRANLNYDNLLQRIQDNLDLLQARYNVAQEIVRIRDEETKEVLVAKSVYLGAKLTQRGLSEAVRKIEKSMEILIEGFPKLVGLANDVFSAQRSVVKGVAFSGTIGLTAGALVAEGVAEGATFAKEQMQQQARLKIDNQGFSYEVQQQFKVLEDLLRQEAVLRVESFELAQALEQASGRYQAAVAKGLRLAEDRAAFRAKMAAQTQESRYRDMSFRIFRNDAIQKYRAQFDLAAQYVFLAAVAYDFETQLLGGDNGAGREFLTDIIRQRSLGQMENGSPIAGRHGLADPLARLGMNFNVLKGQMGFNNPQTETGRFSVRNELLRLGTNSAANWQAELKKCRIENLWDIPEFRRYCRPFAPESAGPQPGLVLRFPTTVTFGLNYFGWPLGGGDSAYDPSLFATKVRSVGVWFSDYNGAGLSITPRVYLVPVGADVMRSPSGNNLETREWRVVDQKIPVPFPIGYSSLQSSSWIPANNSLSDTLADIRRFSSFRAYHDSGSFKEVEVISDSRLIGRSVWNTEWMLIIPGGTFLYDPDRGLDTFIATVGDIKIFFQTYAYSGN